MPNRIWTGIDTVLLRCSPNAEVRADVARKVCDALLARLRQGSPHPVRLFDTAGSAARSPRSVLIDGTIRPSPQPSTVLLAFRIRKAVSVDDAEGEITPPPRPVSVASSQALAASLDRALERVLPWRSAGQPRRFRIRPTH